MTQTGTMVKQESMFSDSPETKGEGRNSHGRQRESQSQKKSYIRDSVTTEESFMWAPDTLWEKSMREEGGLLDNLHLSPQLKVELHKQNILGFQSGVA